MLPHKAVIYCRISRDREGAGLGVERQRVDCEELAAQLGIQVHAVYQDNDLSAYSGKSRPGYREMLEDLRAGRADTVLAWHTDRLHRSPAELEEYIDVCEPRRIETRTVKAGHLDLTTATGRMIARQLGVQARYEVERMVERQKRKRDEMAQQGKHFGGRRPFGWESDGVTPIEAEAKCIRIAAATVLAGGSVRSLAKSWNKKGIKTSTGGEWTGGEVSRMLRRPRNAGLVVHRGLEVGPAEWPAALDEATFRSLAAVLDDPDRRTSPGGSRKYLGSGLYVCGVCAETLLGATSNGRNPGAETRYWPAYRCKTRKHLSRRRDLLDDFVQLTLLNRLARADAADLLAERDDPVDVRAAQADMAGARATLDELAAALGAGALDMRSWQVASEGARKRLADAEARLGCAVKVNPVAGLVGAENLDEAWGDLGLSRQRAVIDYMMTVTIHPARKGRMPGGGYWDSDAVKIKWK